MIATNQPTLQQLFDQDETAWLETMAHLSSEGRHAEMDYANLSEYLTDMAKRDRRVVSSRLVLLLMHLLKWDYQTDHRTGSWMATILEQRRALRELLESGTLRQHACAILAEAYSDACKQASAETGLAISNFPHECTWDLESLLDDDDKIEDTSR